MVTRRIKKRRRNSNITELLGKINQLLELRDSLFRINFNLLSLQATRENISISEED
jgi:hypothetical protein